MGKNTGATPDGRMKGEPISENQSPAYGADKSGVTACLNSMSKLPFSLAPGGGTNLTIHPSMVAGESGVDVLSHLVEGYFQNGGMHLHINVIDKSTLEDAQRYPEKYSTLSVRVTGYSAYFVQLNKDIQADIIARTKP
jgi:formate C-acetyltransferase